MSYNGYSKDLRKESGSMDASSATMSPSPFEQNDSLMIIHPEHRQHPEDDIDKIGANLFGISAQSAVKVDNSAGRPRQQSNMEAEKEFSNSRRSFADVALHQRNCKSSSRQISQQFQNQNLNNNWDALRNLNDQGQIRGNSPSINKKIAIQGLVGNFALDGNSTGHKKALSKGLNYKYVPLTAGRNQKRLTASQIQQPNTSSNSTRPEPDLAEMSRQEPSSPLKAQTDKMNVNSLQQKLHINLKNLNSTSGGSSCSYSNKDLSERIYNLMTTNQQFQQQTQGQPLQYPSPGYQQQFAQDTTSSRTGGRFSGGLVHQDSQQQQQIQQMIQNPIGLQQSSNSNNDPYEYLHRRQQKHKSCRSAYPNHQVFLLQQQQKATGNPKTLRVKPGSKKAIETNSSYSNSSNTTVPLKSLSEVKNPSLLISFRFVNRKVFHLNEISRFKNLTELDVKGNLLQNEVSELKQLNFLKKLNLEGNQISEMWELPPTLEILNFSRNLLRRLNPEVTRKLYNLSTFDLSYNGLESLEHIQHLKKLKRLLAKENQIQDLTPLADSTTLVDIDLENNPVDSVAQVLKVIPGKKDILAFNLRLSPLIIKIQSFEEFIKTCSESSELKSKVDKMSELLSFFINGTFYRSKKVYQRMRQQQQIQDTKRSISNFSNRSSSNGGITNHQNTKAAFSPLLNLTNSNSGNNAKRKVSDRLNTSVNKLNQSTREVHNAYQCYETMELLLDKILEDEDKLLLNRQKKEKREKRMLRKERAKDQQVSDLSESESDIESENSSEEDDLYDSEDEMIDEIDDLEDMGHIDQDDLLDELKTYQRHQSEHMPVEEQPNDFLNESTADFNKAIKQINQELLEDGQLDPEDAAAVVESRLKAKDDCFSDKRESTDSKELGKLEINVPASVNSSRKQPVQKCSSPDQSEAKSSSKKPQLAFKLDLSKCGVSSDSAHIDPKHIQKTQQHIVTKQVKKVALPPKNQSQSKVEKVKLQDLKEDEHLHQFQSAQVVKKQGKALNKVKKQILIPRLALQKIQKQTSDLSQNSQFTPSQNGLISANLHSILKTYESQNSTTDPPKPLKILSSKRVNNSNTSIDKDLGDTLKQNSIQEYQQLQKELQDYKSLLVQIKKALGNELLTDSEVIPKIECLVCEHQIAVQSHQLIQDRQQMQIEDLSVQVQRLFSKINVKPTIQIINSDSANLDFDFSSIKKQPRKLVKTSRNSTNYNSSLSISGSCGQNQLTSRAGTKAKGRVVVIGEQIPTVHLSSKQSKQGQNLHKVFYQHGTSVDGIQDYSTEPVQNSDFIESKQKQKKTQQQLSQTKVQNYFVKNKEKILNSLANGTLKSQESAKKQLNATGSLHRGSSSSKQSAFNSVERIDKVNKLSSKDGKNVQMVVNNNNQKILTKTHEIRSKSNTGTRVPKSKAEHQEKMAGYFDNVVLSSRDAQKQMKPVVSKKVGIYLEKMRERNSSLQERLNQSYKTTRLDSTSREHHSSILTQRPLTALLSNKVKMNHTERQHKEAVSNYNSALI